MNHEKRRSTVELLERRFLMSATYNRTAAVAYANQYAYKVVSDGYFWINSGTTNYYGAGSPVPVNVTGEASGIGDDCAHFVSSCIGTPGGGLTIPSRAGTYGEPGAARLDELLVGNSLGGYGTTYQYGQLVSSVSQLQPGDVIGYDWDGSGGGSMSGIDHTVIYIGNGEVDAHATSHQAVAWNFGNDSSTVTFFIHITVSSTTVPNTPTNSLPANNAIVTTTTPTLSASAFAETGATQSAAEWEILNGSTVVYDTGTDTTHKTSLAVPTGKITSGNTYTWQVRYEDNSGNWSAYSTATSFAVTVGPYTPANSSPANSANLLNPVVLSASTFSDTQTSATHTATEWLVKNSSSTAVFDSGTDATDLSSVTVPSADLTTGQTYSWQVRYEDNSGFWSTYSTATSFSMAVPSLLTLPASTAYYLQDSANGQSLNIWNASTDTGTPAQTIQLGTISKIIINGASGGSIITLDFSNGNLSPQNRITVLGGGSSSNNTLAVLGSTGNDTVSYNDGQFTINGTLVAYSGVGTFGFTPGSGTDSLSLSSGTLNLNPSISGTVQLSSLSMDPSATLNIGSDILNLSYVSGSDPISSIQSLISSGYNNNSWAGTGIISSSITNFMTSAIGYYDTGSMIIIRATWKGDANCDGVINSDDLSIMLLSQAQQKINWPAGNFNYDAQIDADDSLDFNYAVAYSNGRNYATVFAPGTLGSAAQMNQLLNTTT